MFTHAPARVLYAYGAWQEKFEEIKAPGVEFHAGLPSREKVEEWTDPKQHTLLILYDLMHEACASTEIMSFFTIYCHHKHMSLLLLSQNIFPPGKSAGTISLNCHYIVLFKTKRDRLQVQTLGSQILPGEKAYFMDAYQHVTSQPYGYLVCDLYPGTNRHFQLRTHIFPDEATCFYTPRKKVTLQELQSFTSKLQLK